MTMWVLVDMQGTVDMHIRYSRYAYQNDKMYRNIILSSISLSSEGRACSEGLRRRYIFISCLLFSSVHAGPKNNYRFDIIH